MQAQGDEARSRPNELLRSLGHDPQLDAWAQKLQAQADTFIANKPPDPLDALFLVALR
jgi:hypothetical protein